MAINTNTYYNTTLQAHLYSILRTFFDRGPYFCTRCLQIRLKRQYILEMTAIGAQPEAKFFRLHHSRILGTTRSIFFYSWMPFYRPSNSVKAVKEVQNPELISRIQNSSFHISYLADRTCVSNNTTVTKTVDKQQFKNTNLIQSTSNIIVVADA